MKGANSGQSLIELLVAIGLSMLLLPTLIIGFAAARNGRPQQDQRLQAVFLLKEEEESVRSVRENGWTNLNDGTFNPVLANGKWSLASGYGILNGFTRQVVISDVYRDNNGAIVTSGGTNDLSTKKAVMSVSWSNPIPSSVNSTMYFTRYADNGYTESTYAQFNSGTKTNVSVTNTNGGEVTLGSGAGSGNDWCDPGKSVVASINLPGQGITEDLSATTSASLDYAYTTTGGNKSGDSMDSVSITHANPPVVSNIAAYNNYKTYGLFVDNLNQYVYLTSDHPNLTVDIVETVTQPFTETGTFNASQGGAGSSVAVSFNSLLGHDVGYVTAGNVFYTFDLASKTGPRPQLGFASLAGTGKKIVVVGNFAYVAVDSDVEQLDIYDISNPNKPTIVSHIDVNNGEPATDVFVNSTGTRAYLVTKQSSNNTNDFFIIDTTNKVSTLPSPIGAFNSNAMSPTGVISVTGNRAIVVGYGGQQYQVLNIANEAAVSYCGGLTLSNGIGINAIASIYRMDQTAFSYILTSDPSNELQIIQGGNGVPFSPSGMFESQTFEASSDAMFNTFTTSAIVPSQTSLTFQVAIKNEVSNSCDITFSNTDFVGPDGTSNTFFPSTGGILPQNATGNGYVNPGQCLRYRAYLSTSDITEAPEFYSISFNYSP